ncbi:MAG: hypothetical protein JWP06_960 [Candidatus Saccharibacteria bacterium]|nr:hypothetical protein [Candidatus Saccharibacteria bacterium]
MNGGRINATIGGNTAGAGALVSSGTMTLVGGNNVTLSQNGNAITISGAAAGGGSQTFGMSNLGNTAGISGVVSGSAVRYAFAGGNNITLNQSINGVSGTMTISAANQTVQTQNLHNMSLAGNTSGVMAQISSGTLMLAGGNNITLSQNGNAVTISAGAGGGGGGIALANSQTTLSSGTVNLIASGALTIASTTGQSFNLSVPQTSSLSATGALSISSNGATISIGAPAFSAGMSNLGNTSGTSGTASNQVVFAGGNNITLSQATGAGGNTITIAGAGGGGAGGTLSRFEYMEGLFTSLNTVVAGSLSLNHMYVPFNVSGSAMKIGGSLSAATNTSATVASANISLWMGIYTLNGSTLSLASSGSANNGFQWSHSASTTANSSVQSMRQMTVPMNVNMTPGEYWVGAVLSSATTYTSAAFTIYGNDRVASGATNAVLTPIGGNTTVARDAMLFQGIYTALTSAGPTTIVGSQINNTSASNVQRANFYNVIYNATY